MLVKVAAKPLAALLLLVWLAHGLAYAGRHLPHLRIALINSSRSSSEEHANTDYCWFLIAHSCSKMASSLELVSVFFGFFIHIAFEHNYYLFTRQINFGKFLCCYFCHKWRDVRVSCQLRMRSPFSHACEPALVSSACFIARHNETIKDIDVYKRARIRTHILGSWWRTHSTVEIALSCQSYAAAAVAAWNYP